MFKPALLTLTASTALILAGSTLSFAQVESDVPPVTLPSVETQQQPVTLEALSQGQLSLTAIPTRLGDDMSLALDPGATEQVTLQVINTGDEAVTIRSNAFDFVVFDDTQTPTPIEGDDIDNRWSLASWLTITPATQTINPGELVSMNVVIQVPDDALPGGHYAMITHQPSVDNQDLREGREENTQAAGVQQRVGTLLYVMVNGFVNEDAVIREFSIANFTEFGPVPFAFTVENLSDIHIQPRITMEIHNMFGQRIESIQFDTRNIFPFTAWEYEGKWDRIWGFGPYTAKIVMSYGSQGNVTTATERFWLLPISLVVAVVVVLLAAIAGGVAIRRHIIHRKQDQSKRIQELESKLEKLQSDKLNQFED